MNLFTENLQPSFVYTQAPTEVHINVEVTSDQEDILDTQPEQAS